MYSSDNDHHQPAMSQQSPPDLIEVLKTDISTPLPTDITESVLTSTPFIKIPGVFNCRDSSCHNLAPSTALKHGFAFRSGTLEQMGPEGEDHIKKLGIKAVFDLRSLKETTEFPDPFMGDIESITAPNTFENETTVQAQKSKEEKEDHTLIGMYLTIFETHTAMFKVALLHIRDHPNDAFLFHCTAGKDRTAVFAYLLHALAGSPLDVMDLDYALTRIGVEPVREFLTTKLTGGGKVDVNDPRVAPYASVPVDGMSQLDAKVRAKYGSVEGYVKETLKLGDADVESLKANLRRAK